MKKKTTKDIRAEDRGIDYYKNEFLGYACIYETVSSEGFKPADFLATLKNNEFGEGYKDCTPWRKVLILCERAFYNCLAMSGKLSFSSSREEISLCLDFIKLTENFMFFTGLEEDPDEMGYAVSAIMHFAMASFHGIVTSEKDSSNGLSEKEYEKIIARDFDKIEQFKKYRLIGSQTILPHGDRLDFLAEDIISKRQVIIELKRGNKSGHKQLRSYAVSFDNPILINISVKDVLSKRKDIIYYTFKELRVE